MRRSRPPRGSPSLQRRGGDRGPDSGQLGHSNAFPSVETGRSNKREWVLGNPEIDLETRALSGQLAYERPAERAAGHYDVNARSWRDLIDVVEQTAPTGFMLCRNPGPQNPAASFVQQVDVATVFATLINRANISRPCEGP